MTSYLDDTWLQDELQRFEDTKRTLREAAALLERATTAVPQLQRGLEQLDQYERDTRLRHEELTSQHKQELVKVVMQAQAQFDDHVQQVIQTLSSMSEAGQLLELRQDVTGLLTALPALEGQVGELTNDLRDIKGRVPARLEQLETLVTQVRGDREQSATQLTALLGEHAESQVRLDQLTGRAAEMQSRLKALQAGQENLQQAQRHVQAVLESQGEAAQQAAQHLTDLVQNREHTDAQWNASLATLGGQVREAQAHLTRLDSRQITAETRLKQVEQFLEKLSGLPDQVNALDGVLKDTRTQLEVQRTEASTRHAGQREALKDLERQIGSVQTRASRFIAWFEKAGAMTRLRGKPE